MRTGSTERTEQGCTTLSSDSHKIVQSVDVAAVLDEGSLRGPALAVFVLTTVALVFDGFDIQAMAFVAPALLPEWGGTRAALAPILALGLIGMALGALFLSGLGDRYGRRRALICGMLVVAAGATCSALSNSFQSLGMARLLTGLGLGLSAPNAIALMIEFTPRKFRNILAAITLVGIPIGGMLGAEASAHLLPAFGWRSIFYLGAALPALAAVALGLWLTESPRFLARFPSRRAELVALLNRIAPGTSTSPDAPLRVIEPERPGERSGIAAILSKEHRRETLVIWFIFFTDLFAVYILFNWLPTALSSVGLPTGLALRGAVFFNLGGVAGALLGALAMNRWGSRPVLIVLAAAAVAVLCMLGLLPIGSSDRGAQAGSAGALMALMTAAGVAVLGVQVTMYSVAAHAYPTRMRVSGLGWAQGIARLGGIVSSVAGSLLLALGDGVAPFFFGIAAILLLTFIGVFALARHVAPTSAVALD